jgi:hypothetical protein
MAETKSETKVDTQQKTVAGYSGSEHEGKKATERPKSVSEEAVVSPLGYTEPSEQSDGPVSYKKRLDVDRIHGLCLLEGDTFSGFHRKIIVELGSLTTQEGAYNVFRGHFPDAIHDGFKAKSVTQEEADKLNEDWKKEKK